MHLAKQTAAQPVSYTHLDVYKRQDTIITDLAVIDVTPEGLVLREVAPGFTPEEVQTFTEPKLRYSTKVPEMRLQQR